MTIEASRIPATRLGSATLFRGSPELHIDFLAPWAEAQEKQILVLGRIPQNGLRPPLQTQNPDEVLSAKRLFLVGVYICHCAIKSSLARAKNGLRVQLYP